LLISCIVLFTTYTSTGQTDIKNSFFWWTFLPVFLSNPAAQGYLDHIDLRG
jgi:hypothetical protein